MSLQRFIVPIQNVSTFCTFLNGQLQSENPLPMVGHGEHAIDDEFGWVAWIADSGKAIGRTHLDAVEGEGGFSLLAMPDEYKAECLLFHRQVLFVGGDCGKEVIGAFDFAAPQPKWVPLEVPEQFRRHGKRIDDFLRDGDRLIAIDDVIFPKYLLRYDITDPRSPRLIDVGRLLPHSGNETIHCGAIGKSWIAILSHSFTKGGGSYFIALLDRTNLGEYSRLYAPSDDSFTQKYSRTAPKDMRTWLDIAFHDDALLIAAGKYGIGVLDLGPIPRPNSPLSVTDRLEWRSRTPAHDRFDKECGKSLRYIRLASTDGSVVRVQPIADSRHYLAVVESQTRRDTVVMELP